MLHMRIVGEKWIRMTSACAGAGRWVCSLFLTMAIMYLKGIYHLLAVQCSLQPFFFSLICEIQWKKCVIGSIWFSKYLL